MYVLLSRLILMIIIYGLCTLVLMSSSTNNNNDQLDPIVRNLKHIVDTAFQQDASEDLNNELLIGQLSRILEQQEGFRLNDRQKRSMYPIGEDETPIFDGSGDVLENKDLPPFYSNMTLVTITMVSFFSIEETKKVINHRYIHASLMSSWSVLERYVLVR